MTKAANHFLVLYPANPEWVPDNLETFTKYLRQTGLIGNQIKSGQFSTGPNYLDLITYLGCSPQITLGETEADTLVSLNGLFESQRFRFHPNVKPRCPACRGMLKLERMPKRPDEILTCPHCETRHQAIKIDWRRKAGFGRFLVEISNIYESEAVPGEGLLEKLEHITGQAWDYFYSR